MRTLKPIPGYHYHLRGPVTIKIYFLSFIYGGGFLPIFDPSINQSKGIMANQISREALRSQIESDMGHLLAEHQLTSEEVVDSLIQTREGFEIRIPLHHLWAQERPYFQAHGMSAFDAGYCGKLKSSNP